MPLVIIFAQNTLFLNIEHITDISATNLMAGRGFVLNIALEYSFILCYYTNIVYKNLKYRWVVYVWNFYPKLRGTVT